VHHPERSDRREGFALRTVQFVRSFPTAHQLAVWALRKIDLPTEYMPSTILADVVSVAPAREP
jgi:hypothetical protein